MGIQICRLNLDHTGHETELRGTPMFPCAAYTTDFSKCLSGDVPWHWHEEIEINVVKKGTAYLRLDGMEVMLKEHEGIFINSNVLHFATAASSEGCIMDALVFYPSLLSGTPESVFEQKYIRPLLTCKSIAGIPFFTGVEWQRQAAELIEEACILYDGEDFGYELLIREKLSTLWYLLLSHMQPFLKAGSATESQESIRIKEMMNYIQSHYHDCLTLFDIASAAHISERECLRCFQKALGTPPIQYLMKYRVSVAAEHLLTSDAPVTDIAAACGFDSPSYFTRIFKRMIGKTPSEYRKGR